MRITCLGGGPAGLYAAILLKKQAASHEVTVVERNAPGQTFGWGVVFSDETMSNLEEADKPSYDRIIQGFSHWRNIDIHRQGRLTTSTGHGFAGLSRKTLLEILQARAQELGCVLKFDHEVSDIEALRKDSDLLIASDGINSRTRTLYADSFKPTIDKRKCKYIWLGTKRPFPSFTFAFEQTPNGIYNLHAYQFDRNLSTFIVETPEEVWEKDGLGQLSIEDAILFLEKLFARTLAGEKLLNNHASFIHFLTVKNASWHHDNVVLLGDAAHTAHFSIGSGTKLALEDAIALAAAIQSNVSTEHALFAYEEARMPMVGRTQKAAQDSLMWFEDVKRSWAFSDLGFAFALLTRSKRITYDNLALRDPSLVLRATTEYVARTHHGAVGTDTTKPTPPMFTKFKLRDMVLENRVVVSPMCMYSAKDGVPQDFHLVHLGARAMGGAGLLMTEMTCVSRDARITPGCTGMWNDEQEAAWKRIVDFVHANGHAKVGMQLGHAGRKGSTKLLWEGMDEPLDEGNWPIVSASPLPYTPKSQVPGELSRKQMDEIGEQFVSSVRRADRADFDLVEIHLAHGYLLGSFLSPITNHRTDAYGGTLENRMRFPLEVFARARAAFPKEKPMSVRISAHDWVDGGFLPEDGVVVAAALKALGLDVLDVSSGQTTKEERPVYGRMFQSGFSEHIRNAVGIPTITVGNISTPDQVNSILLAERADLVALARPHLDDPNWTLHAATLLGHALPNWPPQYSTLERTRLRK